MFRPVLLILLTITALAVAENFTNIVYFDRGVNDELLSFEIYFTFPTLNYEVHTHSSIWSSETDKFTQLRFEFSHVSFWQF